MLNVYSNANLDIDPAVGEACASEFRSFCKIYKTLPSIEPILKGKASPKFPSDLSAKYALTCALAVRAKTVKEVENALLYVDSKAGAEWLTQCTYDVSTIWRSNKKAEQLVDMIIANKKLIKVAENVQKLLAA